MAIRVEIYTAEGIAIGEIAASGRLREILEGGTPLTVESVTWHPIDAGREHHSAGLTIDPDAVHVVSGEEMDELPIHAEWHDVVLVVGPFAVSGQMPTMPGFDPGRALARPTGDYVQLRDARIGLTTEPEGALARPSVLVNRYVVDRVEADLMLGFYFPGAEMISIRSAESADPTAARMSANASPAAIAESAAASAVMDGVLVPSRTATIPFVEPPSA